MLDEIRATGGEVFAITSEPQTLATEAEDDWEFSFPAIGDGQGNGLIGPINPLAWSISRVRQNNIPEAQVIWLLTLGLLMLRQKVFFT